MKNNVKTQQKPVGIALEEIGQFLYHAEKRSTVENPAGVVLVHNPEQGWCFFTSCRREEVKRMLEGAPFLQEKFFPKE